MIKGIIGVQQNTLTIPVNTEAAPAPLFILTPSAYDLMESKMRIDNRNPIIIEKITWIGVINLTAERKNVPNGSMGNRIKYKAVIAIKNKTNITLYFLIVNNS